MSEIFDRVEGTYHDVLIVYDDCPWSPADSGDGYGCILYRSNRYFGFGDHGKSFSSSEELDEHLNHLKDDGAFILPVYAYVHSGVSIATTPFSCRWDSGQTGFIVVTQKQAMEYFLADTITPDIARRVQEGMKAHISQWNQYFTGEVYGLSIVAKDSDDLIAGVQSTWGIYGIESAREIAREMLAEHEPNREKAG
jgi:hypothetical protein